MKTVAEEIREQLSEFTLFDDDFMREFFQDNIECVELVVQIILENPKLKVKSVDIQHDIKNYGHRDVTPIGMLIHDFSCKESKDMKFEKLAEKMKYYKEDVEGGKKMCDKLQAIWDRHEPEVIAKTEANAKREFATRLLKSSKMSKTEISLMADLKLSEVEELAKVLEI